MPEQILNTTSHISSVLLLLYGLILWRWNSSNDFSQKVLGIFLVARSLFASLPILNSYGLSFISHDMLQQTVLTSGLVAVIMYYIYPIAIISPTRIKPKQLFLLFFPLIPVVFTMFAIQEWGTGFRTIHSFAELLTHIGEFNVWFRLLVFLSAFIYTGYMVLYLCNAIRSGKYETKNNILRFYAGFVTGIALLYVMITFFSTFAGIVVQHLYIITGWTLLFSKVMRAQIHERNIINTTKHKPVVTHTNESPAEKPNASMAYRIVQLTEEQKPYLDKELTLKVFTQMLNTNRTTVVAHLHRLGYENFTDYLAANRIKEFKQLAQNAPESKIEELCLHAGFGSKNSFFRVFKKHEGTTPGEYIRNL